MSKRLEEIKGNFKKGYPFTSRAVREIQILEDFKWLIEQAERVEKLEKENKLLRFIAEENKIAYEQRAKQNKRYREALEFYADERNHERGWNTFTDSGLEESEVMKDGGEIARKILEGDNE